MILDQQSVILQVELTPKIIFIKMNVISTMKTLLFLIPIFFLLIGGCDMEGLRNENLNGALAELSTYEVIQREIWDQSCIGCHIAQTSYGKQSGLVLTADVSYNQLINRVPTNIIAAADGLLLVGDRGYASLPKSFLWEKINANNFDHFYQDHPEYGAIMPLGDNFLTNGELEFIRQWIEAGAPESGQVASVELLANKTRYTPPPFEALSKPENGYQFHIEPFTIKPGMDREIFIYEKLNNSEPIYINRVEIAMQSGSHHFLIYQFNDRLFDILYPPQGAIRDVYNESGNYVESVLFHLQYHDFVTGTQWPKMDYHYPEGVAFKIPADFGFDLNSHYVNTGTEDIVGEVYANLYTIPENEVVHVAKLLDVNNDEIYIPANTLQHKVVYEFIAEEVMNVFQLFSHAHSNMTEFRVYATGGENDEELIYITYDWEHPPIKEFSPPLLLEPGHGFRLETTYDNPSSKSLQFGLRSTDEMMILFGAYY